MRAGTLAGLLEKRPFLGPDARLFLFTGILGGFTTFSAFGLETIFLLQRREAGLAALNVGLSLAAGLAALWLGMKAAS